MKITSLLLAAAVALSAGTAFAANTTGQAPEARAEKRWDRALKRMDLNKDGVLSRDEIKKNASAKAARFDADGNGVVTRAEFVSSKPVPKSEKGTKRRERSFDKLDTGKAGKVATTVIADDIAARVMKADADKDGKITKAEFLAKKRGKKQSGKAG